jgi:hypothetical protein
MKSLSMVRLLIFVTISITLSIVYYKNILKVESGGNKNLTMVKHILGLLVLFGLLSVFSSMKGNTGKSIILVVIILIINVFNINQSITKCDYPTLYKVNLFGRSSFVIIIISMLLYYSYEEQFFRFLYAESELDSSSKSITNKFTVDELEDELKLNSIPPYCPDIPAEIEEICVSVTNDQNSKCSDNTSADDCGNDKGCKFTPKYKTTAKWKTISSKQKNNCLAAHAAKYQRSDITDKLYA